MIQERILKNYKSVKLPTLLQDEDRGFFRCCVPELVLASNNVDSYKNDITPAWIKLSSPLDTVQFTLVKCNGTPTIYTTELLSFIKEDNAYYVEVHWRDVLASDGIGTYSIMVNATISGIPISYKWGQYELKQFSVESAMRTARIRAIFNSYHEIEGIDFTDSNVNGTFRFKGFIGNRQPNKQIDNLIYSNREMKSVVRENLNTYEMMTDPLKSEYISKLTDLYLLSENQLFISDHNAHNNSYNYFDLPVILDTSDEITYFELSRDAKMKAVFADKFKNKRNYFK